MATELDQKYDIVDERTPSNEPLRAHFKRSFAYYTISERLPVILTQVIDRISKDKDDIVAECGNDERSRDDIKEVLGGISGLKYELQTDKPFADLTGSESDRDAWNEFIAALRPAGRDSFFTTVWLYAECYMYRRLKSIFERTPTLQRYDYFATQKQAGLTGSDDTVRFVAERVQAFNREAVTSPPSPDQLRDFGIKLLKLSLWGNRCDLSISLGRQIQQEGNAFTALEGLDEFLLVDRCEQIWQCLLEGQKNSATIIDFVLDNSGYELYTDLVLAQFLLRFGFAQRVRFHVKAIPWFISDVMHADFEWTLRQLTGHEAGAVAELGQALAGWQKEGRIEVRPLEFFWTGPWEFKRMKEVRADLYADLAQAHLVLFKGDLNYRKLLGDFNWDFGARFEDVLCGFRPTNVCSLRTVKADLVCELKEGVAEKLSAEDPMWMETGQYGVVHFAAKE